MSDVVIRVENLSKKFRLGMIGSRSFSNELKKYFGKSNLEDNADDLWALQDINFDVKKGEVFGIVGKNGAGKSVMLKILSQLTAPTSGTAKIKGRVASLLEVGTGFHQELSGRENIFLNGSILGMRTAEIKQKFDEILAFSGVEKFIDTPVKRYSSGMKVRLGFAVAAHLEPEILIIDEVLAVGDADFQKKCLGKMKEVSGHDGRTIIFVSHNLTAVRDLCSRGIYLESGKKKFEGEISEVIENYLLTHDGMAQSGIVQDDYIRNFGTLEAKIRKVTLSKPDGSVAENLMYRQKFTVKIEFEALQKIENVSFAVRICSVDSTVIALTDSISNTKKFAAFDKGNHAIEVEISEVLMPMAYYLSVSISNATGMAIDNVERVYDFHVLRIAEDKGEHYRWTNSIGFVEAKANWKI